MITIINHKQQAMTILDIKNSSLGVLLWLIIIRNQLAATESWAPNSKKARHFSKWLLVAKLNI